MTEQIVDITEANMPASSDAVAAARSAGGVAGEEAGRVAAAALAGDMRDRLATVSARVDVLAASGSDGGDVGTELRDVRVGVDGRTYASAGDAVRIQVGAKVGPAYVSVTQDALEAPWNDMDTVPANRVVFYALPVNGKVRNAPPMVRADSGGTLVTFCGMDGTDGMAELFVESGGGAIHTRILMGSWTPWATFGDASVERLISSSARFDEFLGANSRCRFLTSAGQVEAPYDDMDTLPLQSIVTYAFNAGSEGGVAHLPDGMLQGATVATIGTSIGSGRFQLLMRSDGGPVMSRINWGSSWTPWSDGSEGTADGTRVPWPEWSCLSLFERIGVVGDSFASGEVVLEEGSYIDHYSISWPRILARRCGVSVTNFTRGGLDTRSWLTDDMGLTLMESTEPQNLYLLALGINDANRDGLSYLGSTTDMTDDPDSNPDTFYGNYARIISRIRAHAPAAKIVMTTLVRQDGAFPMFNQAIRDIAGHHGVPVMDLRDDPFFTGSFYQRMQGGHPTSVVYAGMAMSLDRLFAKCAMDNQPYFDDYIGND